MATLKMLLPVAVLWLGASAVMAQKTYLDPEPYCKAVGTIDKPDMRYSGPKLPTWMARRLNLQTSQGKLMEWRCADGAVLACLYGANIPCDAKAVAGQKPTSLIIQYCLDHPGSAFVPMVVTGHDTSLSWACRGSKPAVIHAAKIDAQGYQASYWHKVSR